jgi:hypothetical protein
MTICYCPPVTGWSSYTPMYWVPFLFPSTIRKASSNLLQVLARTVITYYCVCIFCRGKVFTAPLSSKGRIYSFHYSGTQSSCLAVVIICRGINMRRDDAWA